MRYYSGHPVHHRRHHPRHRHHWLPTPSSSYSFAFTMPKQKPRNKFDNPATVNVPFETPLWKQETKKLGVTPGCYLGDLPPFERMSTYWEKRLWMMVDAHSHPQGVSLD